MRRSGTGGALSRLRRRRGGLATGLAARAMVFALAFAALLVSGAWLQPVLAQQDPLSTINLPGIGEGAPMLVQADEMLYDYETETVTAEGNVQIYYADYVLIADRVIYDRGNDQVTAEGNVQMTEPDGNVVRADRLTVTGDFREGFVSSLSLLTPENARVVAESAERSDGNILIFNKAVYTPCEIREAEGRPPLWQIKAVRVIHNQEKQIIEYRSATFEFLGVPIAYMPYFYHPDPTVKRKSGFLAPRVGYTTQLGFFSEIPYFWAIAPNYDMTLSPRVLSRQGVLMKGEFRQRLANGSYLVRPAGIYQLDPTAFNPPGNRDWRGSLTTVGEFRLGDDWVTGWTGTWVSDDTFLDLYDLDSRTELVSQVYLEGESDRNYFAARAMRFQDLARPLNGDIAPLVHPVVDYNYIFGQTVLGGELSFDANVLSLTRRTGPDTNRAIAALSWRRTFTDAIGQRITPFAELRGDIYSVDNLPDPANPLLSRDRETSARGMATAGIEYSYPFIATSSWGSQVIEPVAQVIVRPNAQNLGDINNEDARSLVFDDTTLFQWDKFSGFDLVESGSRANVGLRYTVNLNSGGYAGLLFGQSYQLTGDNPFTPASGLEAGRSDYVGALYLQPSKYFGLSSKVRLDKDGLAINRQEVAGWARYEGASGSLTYIKINDQTTEVVADREEILASAQVPLINEWAAFGSWRYDIEGSRNVRRTFGLQYICDCFSASLEYVEDFTNFQDIEPEKKFIFRFSFKTLGEGEIATDAREF